MARISRALRARPRKAPFLLPMQRVIGGVQLRHDAFAAGDEEPGRFGSSTNLLGAENPACADIYHLPVAAF
ncbi:MAG: hypothetical protein ACT4QA_17115 [Panacagrimonas sp.]